jgi:Uma2 family endonuclease
MIQQLQQTEPHERQWTQTEFDRLRQLGFFDGEDVDFVAGEILVRPKNRFLQPEQRLWSKDEYYRLGDLGYFMGQKAELLGGAIMVTSPQKSPHFAALDRVADVFRQVLGPAVWVRTQGPLDLGLVIEPEPDVSVVGGSRADYKAHPTTALLVVEVSDSTLAFDRRGKAGLYASGGIEDYWIVNLVDNQLEVRRNPLADNSQPHGHAFADTLVMIGADTVTPIAFPAVVIPVADLLP